MPAKAKTGWLGTSNQCSGFLPSSPGANPYSEKAVTGTRQRRAGVVSIDRQKLEFRFRTFVTYFVSLTAPMKIATYNVNGINGRLPVLLRWLEEAQPDVVCLQELKAPDEKFPLSAIEAVGYGAIWHGQKS